MKSPLILISPPEDEGNDPSISFSPNEAVSGLPNSGRSKVQSVLNATLQVFMAIPEMCEELPFRSKSPVVRDFVDTVHHVTCEATGVADPSYVTLDWWREMAGLPLSNSKQLIGSNHSLSCVQDSSSGNSANTHILQSLKNSIMSSVETVVSSDEPIETLCEPDKVARTLLDNVLGSCRIGSRFIHEKRQESGIPPVRSEPLKNSKSISDQGDPMQEAESQPKFAISTASMASTTGSGSFGSLNSMMVDENTGSYESRRMITIPLGGYSESDTVGVIALINKVLGLAPQPTFFFGKSSFGFPSSNQQAPLTRNSSFGSSGLVQNSIFATTTSTDNTSTSNIPPKRVNTNPEQPKALALEPQPTRFVQLPQLLVIAFHRPISSTEPTVLHRTTVELPMDLDLGFAVNMKAMKAASPTSKEKSTFYKLHGFVTQTEGRFLAYTRIRGGPQWWKIEDETISDTDLGARVASKGVTLALYRLQEKR